MAALPVYSVVLWAYPPGGALLFAQSGPVPAGFVWVVRDIDLIYTDIAYSYTDGFEFTADDHSPLWTLPDGGYPANTSVHWRGRQVLEAGDHLNCSGTLQKLSFRVSGYQLSLP